MKEERYFYVPQAETACELPQDEAVHATRVLRLKEGDSIFLMDGQGSFYKADVTMSSNKRCSYRITEKLEQERPWTGRIHIAMAPTKMIDRVEWMVEKATEIGVDEFSFLECQYSERRNMRADRIEKITVSAMKQSRKAWKPFVNELEDFRTFITQERPGRKFICHCYDEIERQDLFIALQSCNSINEEVTVLIGPEGDFSVEEVKLALANGYESVSLGKSRLRTETAALFAVANIHLSRNTSK